MTLLKLLLESTSTLLSEKVKQVILKHQASIRRQNQRYRAKLLSEKRFLSRKVSKKLCEVLLECPDIGKEIEAFVSDCSVRADA